MPDGSKAKFRDVLAYRRYIIAHGRFMTATGRSGAEMERQKLVVKRHSPMPPSPPFSIPVLCIDPRPAVRP